jgi:D-serine deaminase-like pyridoxal phosphate-dependent protein
MLAAMPPLPGGARRSVILAIVPHAGLAERATAAAATLDLALFASSPDHLTSIPTWPWPGKPTVYLVADVGYGREGVVWDNEEAIEALATAAEGVADRLVVAGVYTHAGHAYGSPADADAAILQELSRPLALVRALRAKKALADRLTVLSVGSTPGFAAFRRAPQATVYPLLTAISSHHLILELHPGNFFLNDLSQVALGAASRETIGAGVVSTVLESRDDRLLLDAGAYALSLDRGVDGTVCGYGEVEGGGWIVSRVSQEVGIATRNPTATKRLAPPPAGSTVLILPNHSCMSAGMHQQYHAVRTRADYREQGEILHPCRGW